MQWMKAIVILISLFSVKNLYAQKLAIDTSIFNKWESLGDPEISADGKYIFYTINRQGAKNSTIILSTSGKWKYELTDISEPKLSSHSKRLYFKTNGDSLCFLQLGSNNIFYIDVVESFSLSSITSNEWLIYKTKEMSKECYIKDILSGKTNSYGTINKFWIYRDQVLLFKPMKNAKDNNELVWLHLSSGFKKSIWKGKDVSHMNFNEAGSRLVFTVKHDTRNTIWYCNQDMEEAVTLVRNEVDEGGKQFYITNLKPRFSKNDKWIFFQISEGDRINPTSKQYPVSVDVWNYKDVKLQSQQLKEVNTKIFHWAVKNISDDPDTHILRIEHTDEELMTPVDEIPGDYVLIRKRKGHLTERNWNEASRATISLMSLNGGRQIQIDADFSEPIEYCIFSPDGKYVVYFDRSKKNYFSYDIGKNKVLNITAALDATWTKEDHDDPSPPPPVGIAGWLSGGEDVLLYDNYDIWKVSLSRNEGSNVTKGYGKKKSIKFRLLDRQPSLLFENHLLLSAFNTRNKYNGFYKQSLVTTNEPDSLTLGPYLYHWAPVSSFKPIKANHSHCYVVRRMSTTEAHNYFITRDFKTFKQITDFAPQKKFWWITSELFSWKSFDGKETQGVLYKPENFDSTKKYPVIFYVYEKLSDNKNKFTYPNVSGGEINIPFFVGNGYLVFTPDIHFRVGTPGKSAYNSIISAAKVLIRKAWIDSAKMGIMGVSFGGYIVNYLITHSTIFSAAVSSSGLSDYISGYGGLRWEGNSRQSLYEISQSRIGATLWDKPELYIENSPIFKADKIGTPLLLMSNKDDGAVPYTQGLEMFLALRRLKKEVWMLQYDGGNHTLYGKQAEDFTIRVKQFFDHFLKNQSAPKWIVEGVPAKLKGKDAGFELVN